MTRISSPVLVVIAFLTLTVPNRGQEQSANVDAPGKSRRPPVTVIRQPNAPVTLKFSIKPIPGKPGLVKITFKAEGASGVKGFHFHSEEVFVEKDGAKGSIVSDSTSLRSLRQEESLIAHENSQAELWVSSVEF